MEERLNQLQAKIEADAGLLEKLLPLETPEEVQAVLKAEGLEFSVDEINDIKTMLISLIDKKEAGDELSDADLEEVAGGVSVTAGVAIAGAVAGLITASSGAISSAIRSRW